MGEDRFPVDVESLALEYSKETSPSDPIVKIKKSDVDNFEGALIKHPNKSQWMILYKENIRSEGRKDLRLHMS